MAAVATESVRASIAMLEKLVAFPTVSRDSNLALIEFVRAHLEGLGAETRLTYDDERRKANLYATLGPKGIGGVALSGHTDVVPVSNQLWSTEPFRVHEQDGKLYGRGTADMKGFIAVALVLAPEFARAPLKMPLHIALSYDEEVGCKGVGRMIADLLKASVKPQSCIVGEPTLMRPVIAHKGKAAFRCTVRGMACHSAYAPRGVNAIEAAAEAIAYLKSMARRHRDRGPYDQSFDIAHTTIHTGLIQGGIALNVVPAECVFEFELRYLPGDDPAALLAEFKHHVTTLIEPEMHAVDANAGFSIEALSELPALHNSAEAPVTLLAQELSGNHDSSKVSFGTDGSQFHAAGIPTVICGPGSIDQAHKPNEFITIEQLQQCERFMRRLLERMQFRS